MLVSLDPTKVRPITDGKVFCIRKVIGHGSEGKAGAEGKWEGAGGNEKPDVHTRAAVAYMYHRAEIARFMHVMMLCCVIAVNNPTY